MDEQSGEPKEGRTVVARNIFVPLQHIFKQTIFRGLH